MTHIEELEAETFSFKQALLDGLSPCKDILQCLQTIPGIDEAGTVKLLVEIGMI